MYMRVTRARIDPAIIDETVNQVGQDVAAAIRRLPGYHSYTPVWIAPEGQPSDRGMVDFAHVIKHLVDDQDPDAEQIVLVMDNLNTIRLARCTKSSSLLLPIVLATSSALLTQRRARKTGSPDRPRWGAL